MQRVTGGECSQPGPASKAATPVITKIPEPIEAPTPSKMRSQTPRLRSRFFSASTTSTPGATGTLIRVAAARKDLRRDGSRPIAILPCFKDYFEGRQKVCSLLLYVSASKWLPRHSILPLSCGSHHVESNERRGCGQISTQPDVSLGMFCRFHYERADALCICKCQATEHSVP